MIQARVPGKLFVAGEYAVLEPGGAAVLVAVDRFLTARLNRRTDQRITVTSSVTDGQPVDITLEDPDPRLPQVTAAIRLCRSLALETGRRMTGFDLTIESELDDLASGTKFGLGSSGAVTVAATRALAEHYNLRLNTDRLLKTALLAGISVDPSGSGGDIAASLLGGWIAYTAPDRDQLSERLRTDAPIASLINQPWPHLTAAPLPAPRTVGLLVGWTRDAVSTRNLVADFRSRVDPATDAYERFLAASNTCVTDLISALRSGDDTAVSRHFDHSGQILRDYATELGLPIHTRPLDTLRRLAHSLGVAAKSSGAGGGDCGIALVPPSLVRTLGSAWRVADIEPLDLGVVTPDRSPDSAARSRDPLWWVRAEHDTGGPARSVP